MSITPELLASVAGILLSLAFAYIKPAKAWFEELDGSYKRLIMLGGGLVAALVLFGLSCAKIELFGVAVTCDRAGALMLVQAFLVFMVSNQTTFLMLPADKKSPQWQSSYVVTYSSGGGSNTIDDGQG